MLEKIREFAEYIKTIDDPEKKIELINQAREIIHQVSPLKHHPVDFVRWVKSETVEKNDYNPNSVAPPEMKLLIKSITEDGYTMPIVTFDDLDMTKIVDGFHRRKSERVNSEIHRSTLGHIPVTKIRDSQTGLSDRMASTIRHNRARGTHSVDLMVNIVQELVEAGMSNEWIMKHIGMDADELLRLKQISGLAALFHGKDFSKAWE